MAVFARVVRKTKLHMIARGDRMQQYSATYRSLKGKALVHVVAPPPKSEEEIKKILASYHNAAWHAWNTLTEEDRLRINVTMGKG